jgi:hypothetical protein
VYLIVLSAILYFRTKAKFSPEENPFEKTSKGMKIVGAIAVGGGSAGMLLAKIIRNISILSVILWAGVLFLDIFFFSFLSYYILMYRHLKAKAPAEKAG